MFGFRHAMREGRHGRGFDGHHAGPRGGRSGRGEGGRGWDEDGPGFGRSGGRRRMFDGGELRLVLLKLIADKPRHGYDLIRAIEERTGGAYAPSPGIVYPTLTLLGEMGLIGEQEAEGARKLFAITLERTDVVPIRRAMHNLRSVLQNRLGEGLDKDRLHEAVALIDEAARKIERL